MPLVLGVSCSFYSLHCNARAASAAGKQTQTKTGKDKIMNLFTDKKSSPTSHNPGAQKLTPGATAKTGPLPTRVDNPPLSRAEIEAKAYEIWLSRGQEQGQDQQHWFEAEQQLRQSQSSRTGN
jgi:hypothetical protein